MTDLQIVPRRIIGTGSPFDILTMIPLIRSHGIPRACQVADDAFIDCEAPISRAVIVDRTNPPGVFNAGDALGFCEQHYQVLAGESDGG